MTTRELINHLEDLIREGKITGASEVFTRKEVTNLLGYADADVRPISRNFIYYETKEKLDGKVTQLIIDARW
jgi:hypothetical protein